MKKNNLAVQNNEINEVNAITPFEQIWKMAELFSQSDLLPETFKGKPANTFIVMELAQRLGMSPLMVAQNIDIIYGRPAFRSQFIIALINKSGRFTPLKFKFDSNNGDPSCIAYATEKESGEVLQGTKITMSMAKAEGWLDKKGSKWKTMAQLMLSYRAASFFGRLYAPEALMGLASEDEVIDVEYNEIPQSKETEFKTISEVQESQKNQVASKPVITETEEPTDLFEMNIEE